MVKPDAPRACANPAPLYIQREGGVKEAVQAGRIADSRYASYLEMLQQSVQRKKVYR